MCGSRWIGSDGECIKNRAGCNESFLRFAQVDYSIFDLAESFGPEITTEGLVAGCGPFFPGSIECAESVESDL